MAEDSSIEIELPIDQSEQARQSKPKNLLAQDVYKKIAEHLKSSLEKAPSLDSQSDDEFDEKRSHEAILIDGSRGTGKSSVLVNLAAYLKDEKDLLILKPVDPTLLEHGDDLLLNVIVAALMRDKIVARALQENEKNAEAFYEQLHELGSALESIQKQKEQFGLDKLRAFMGNQSLAEHVHQLLRKTLLLTNKRLVVLPIDDVDTSLELAFENIEVVRKYLTSPYVVPLISGDLSLYDEVIWREFYGRLTQKASVDEKQAKVQAWDLAEEYQRKVLPLPRRIKLPALTSYLKNTNIILYKKGERLFSLVAFSFWLDALLNERVNGEENSHLDFPIQTVREMTQLISATQDLIPQLRQQLGVDLSTLAPSVCATMMKRLIFMPVEIARAVQHFEEDYAKATSTAARNSKNRTNKDRVYRQLKDQTAAVNSTPRQNLKCLSAWYKALADYFQYHRKGGPAFLTCDTNDKWLTGTDTTSVLAHDLFNPLSHSQKKYENFEMIEGIRQNWSKTFKLHVPAVWLERLPVSSIVPYPSPEKGQPITTGKSGPWAFNPHVKESLHGKAELIRQLIVHWSFYSPNQRSNLILHGRLFELLITSLVRDLSETDVLRMLNRPPFHSMAALAHTKALTVAETPEPALDEPQENESSQNIEEQNQLLSQALGSFVNEVNEWRARQSISVPHSWLAYNTMNKFFNQLGFLPSSKKSGGTSLEDLLDSAIQAFHSIWAAFGSFEKGETFGLPRIVANVNMSSSSKAFEKSVLYSQNIAPFLYRPGGKPVDFKSGSYTFALESHPLRLLLNEVSQHFEHDVDVVISAVASTVDRILRVSNNRRLASDLDDLINRTAKEFNVRLSLPSIDTMDELQLRTFISEIQSRCTSPGLQKTFKSTLSAASLPPRSGRRYLRYCWERVSTITNRGGSSSAEPA